MRKETEIKMANATMFIKRSFLQCENLQWVREVLVNSMESDATKIEFGLEWQGVEKKGVYRRKISDNGKGMSEKELLEYFTSIGISGKMDEKDNSLDDSVHGNFGIGCRISLLPANKKGVVYLSYQNHKGSMIWMMEDNNGQYIIRGWTIENEKGEEETHDVIDPDDMDWDSFGEGIDWSKVAPDWVREHGTCIALIGNTDDEDTFATSLKQKDNENNTTRNLARYINNRFWDLLKYDVRVLEFNFGSREDWPKSESEFSTTIPGKEACRGTSRSCKGAKYYISEPHKTLGKLKDEGIIDIEEGKVRIHWYLWNGERPQIRQYATESGYIAIKYKHELFGFNNLIRQFRNFGICENSVKNRVTIIIEPKTSVQAETWGVYPDTSRARLVFNGYGERNIEMPLAKWGEQFSFLMPQSIKNAILEAQNEYSSSSFDIKGRIKDLFDKIGNRFKIKPFGLDPKSISKITGIIDPNTNKVEFKIFGRDTSISSGSSISGLCGLFGGKGGDVHKNKIIKKIKVKKVNDMDGTSPKVEASSSREDLPIWLIGVKEDFENNEHLCCYCPGKPPRVKINGDASVIKQTIDYHQGQYNELYHEQIKQVILNAFGELAVCKVAHASKLIRAMGISEEKGIEEYLSEKALTVGLLGIVYFDSYVEPRLKSLSKVGIKDE